LSSSIVYDLDVDNLLVEKQNLLAVFKLVMKDLLNSSLRHERLLEKEFFPLKHFFIVFEHILFHGYTGKKSFPMSSSFNRRDLWPIIDLIARKSTDVNIAQISISSKEMTHIRTSLGRVRAWLRLAMMQKRLADYFKILVEQKHDLKELYEHDALIMSDEISIVTGLLVGLNVLDLNFCLKETLLDYPSETCIYYSLYLRERRIPGQSLRNNVHPPGALENQIDELDDYSSLSSSPSARLGVQNGDTASLNPISDELVVSDEQRIANIIDQKNYVEELYRNLQ
jgi:RUN and FYVE domain-containing protein 1/2